MGLAELYHQRADQFKKEAQHLEKIISRYAWSRIALMLVAMGLVYLGFSDPVYFYFTVPLVLVFFFLVKRQFVLKEQKQLLDNLERLNRAEAKAISFDFKEFPNGQRFANVEHPFGYDLDLFGEGSLYQYLNRCATQLGEEQLANDLSQPLFNEEAIQQRQEAVRDLGTKVDFRHRAWAIGRQIKDFEFNRKPLEQWLREPAFIYGKSIYLILKWLLPAITMVFIGMTIYDRSFYMLILMMMVVQLTITGFHSKKVSRFLRIVSEGRAILGNYARLFEWMNEQTFSSTLMQEHYAMAKEAGTQVKKFSSLVNSLESRMNAIAMQFGNGLFMFDFHAVSKLEEWREKNAESLPVWLKSLGEWDALISLANLHYNYPSYTFGKVSQELLIEAVDMGHPLIPTTKRITNTIQLGDPQKIMLITGANMAGKSTFLRSLGVNFVLAHIGAPVCAMQWKSPVIELRSGMRTSDSLQENQSYFFAELHRLQSIMNELRSGKRLLILLDEILKGTNSTDKQLGSRELLKQLKDNQVLVLLATHDIVLGDLEKQYPDHIVNTCFEGKIEEGHLSFDYKLHHGVAQKANATFLMRQMGIIPN
jgi:DNA mismatch repair ATPase MutS